MKAVLIRHGKVNFRWESWYTAHQFDEACMQYDQAPVMKTCYSIPDSKFSSYYIVFGQQPFQPSKHGRL